MPKSVTVLKRDANSEDPLHTTDSSYKTRHNHILEGATTIANGGIGGSHPYLEGITLPSYVGPCSDDDCSWVDEVLALRYLGDTVVTDTNALAATAPFTASTPGSTEWLTAPISYSGGTAYFALKSQNTHGEWSALSNNGFWPHFDIWLLLVLRQLEGLIMHYCGS